MYKQQISEWITNNSGLLKEASASVWEFAEASLKEYKSAELLAGILKDHGFKIQMGVGFMPTAFVATFDNGPGPVIGFLGEYDALPELSQACDAERKPLIEKGYGHGCGHNLLGVGALGAALAMKECMVANGIKGTVQYYGCPAEELLLGKVLMVREGVFTCDIAITWHPSCFNRLSERVSKAMNSAKFNFYGVSSHASSAPESGRSALDGVELMNVGANYLREHIISDARIHYTITNGGQQPNVVPSYSQVWYFVRGPRRKDVEEIFTRLVDISKGAAMMAGVKTDYQLIAGCYDTLHNSALRQVAYENLKAFGSPGFDVKEYEFARDLLKSQSEDQNRTALENRGMKETGFMPLHNEVLPMKEISGSGGGSTDVGDVSWVVPTVSVLTACWPIGSPGHSWQNTAAVRSSIGEKGMLYAAKVMAGTGLDCLIDQSIISRAKEEFNKKVSCYPYQNPLREADVKELLKEQGLEIV
jgi:aminobenzoyl-glutamate utilization protein B